VVLSVISPYRPLSTFLLVVGASGLYTPGPVRLDSVHRPPALFLLRGIRRAAPAQVTACRVVTIATQVGLTASLKGKCNLRRLFKLTLSFFLSSVCNITIATYIYSNTFSGVYYC